MPRIIWSDHVNNEQVSEDRNNKETDNDNQKDMAELTGTHNKDKEPGELSTQRT